MNGELNYELLRSTLVPASPGYLLLTAYRLPPLRGVPVSGTLGPHRSLRQHVTLAREQGTVVTLKIDRTTQGYH